MSQQAPFPRLLTLDGTFDNYNQSVEIPDAPPNAISISKAFGGVPTP